LKPYATSYIQAERTAPEFEYSEKIHYDEGYLATYWNPVASVRWKLETDLRLQAENNTPRKVAGSDLTFHLEGKSRNTFGRDVISIFRVTAQDLCKAWSTRKDTQKLEG
jgi:hypothetical protein